MPTYKEAGVDLGLAERIVDTIQNQRRNCGSERKLLESFGKFSSSLDLADFDNPVITATCDGVGTKLKLLMEYDLYEIAGWDLVAMNVNDVLTTMAQPLMFLDYLGMETLSAEEVERIIEGIIEACEFSSCILGGGETAELPGMMQPGQLELAGFCLGALEMENVNRKSTVSAGDTVIGIPSNGFHANGYSLIRKIINDCPGVLNSSSVNTILSRTRIYYPEIQSLLENEIYPKAMVHVTGGGIPGNFHRVLPEGLGGELRIPAWEAGGVREILNHVMPREALTTFNMGIGWILITESSMDSTVQQIVPEGQVLGRVCRGDTTISGHWNNQSVHQKFVREV